MTPVSNNGPSDIALAICECYSSIIASIHGHRHTSSSGVNGSNLSQGEHNEDGANQGKDTIRRQLSDIVPHGLSSG